MTECKALATSQDVKRALRRDLTQAEQTDLSELLAEATDLVVGYLHPYPVPTPTPGAIKRVVASMVAAVLTRPTQILPETQSLTADGFGVTFTPGGNSPGPYLSAALKQRLRPYRTGMVSVAMSSERYC
ncbi:head-to-tail adaptor [Mycobacterium phage BoostSeason]|uniref:Head-to-tail adaptor n=1 Tax=Mycobacterium phage Mufasa TaxID=1718600 RepID=A0A0M4RQN8_9CAUD|nr:head-to-tail adaptor [Mycobacterium phage Mufasa]ALF00444.1 head-to-tail adaptor [Mycobacterium phage Mufasa]AYN57183.1 head-to-tail adaptor [Mycobacterium phage BoostSeason]